MSPEKVAAASRPMAFVASRAATTPESIAVVDGEVKWTFRQLHDAATRVARDLSALGVVSGQRIAYLGRNGRGLLVALMASDHLNCTFVPVNWRLTTPELTALLADATPTLVLATGEFSETVGAAVERCGVHTRQLEVHPDSPCEWRMWLRVGPAGDEQRSSHPLQIYTSGTTGRPKGVMITAENLGAAFNGAAATWGMSVRTRGLICLPMFHIGGLAYALMVLWAGGRVVLMPEFDPERLVRVVRAQEVTSTLLVPSALHMLLDADSSHGRDLASLERIVYGGAPMPHDLLTRALGQLACGFLQSYAMTETTGHLTYLPPEDHDPYGDGARLRSAGMPYRWASLRTVDPATSTPLPQGEVGEVWARTPTGTPGYWRQPDETERLRTEDGWIRTGDMGHVDGDGYLYLRGRTKEMIISGGENVFPGEVEHALAWHPGIREIAVFGVRDEFWGERIEAAIVPEAEHELELAEIDEFARAQLASFKVPRCIHVVDKLPRNALGKLQRHRLPFGTAEPGTAADPH